MEIWVIGPDSDGNLSGSYLQKIYGQIGGRPTPPDADVAVTVVAETAALAYQAPVLHDISDGGLAIALAEICIASGIGASVDVEGIAALFSEGPHRVLAVAPPGTPMPDLSRRIGIMGGDDLVFGPARVKLADASAAWRSAIPRAMSA